MAEHTPGPWHMATEDGWKNCFIYAKGHTIASMPHGVRQIESDTNLDLPQYEDEANARLIAAAPALLAACEAVAGVFEGQEDVPLYVHRCRAAIALAKEGA